MKEFTCTKCKKELDASWFLGPYGWSREIQDKYRDKEYCEPCFKQLIKKLKKER